LTTPAFMTGRFIAARKITNNQENLSNFLLSYHVRAIAHYKSALTSIWGKKMNHGRSTGHDIIPYLLN